MTFTPTPRNGRIKWKLSGDKDWLIEECKKRFIVSGYRIKYYEALKEVIDRSEWPAFFDELWKMPDWEHDYEDAERMVLDSLLRIIPTNIISRVIWEAFYSNVKC